MNGKTNSIESICRDLKARGEGDAAELIERFAHANAELGDKNVELLNALIYLRETSTGLTHDQWIEAMELASEIINRETGETE